MRPLRTTAAALIAGFALCAGAARAQVRPPDLPDLKPGDLVFFKTPDKARQDFYEKATGAPITHVGVMANDKNGVLKMWHMIGDKNNSTRSGRPTVKTGLMKEDPVPYLAAERDALYKRAKWPPLTPRQSAGLTAFLESQIKKPYDDKGTLFSLGAPKYNFVPPAPSDSYFCSELAGCVVAGIVGPMELTVKNPVTGTLSPVTDPFGRKTKVYLHPDGIMPADLFMTGKKATVDISSEWKDPLPMVFPKPRPQGNFK